MTNSTVMQGAEPADLLLGAQHNWTGQCIGAVDAGDVCRLAFGVCADQCHVGHVHVHGLQLIPASHQQIDVAAAVQNRSRAFGESITCGLEIADHVGHGRGSQDALPHTSRAINGVPTRQVKPVLTTIKRAGLDVATPAVGFFHIGLIQQLTGKAMAGSSEPEQVMRSKDLPRLSLGDLALNRAFDAGNQPNSTLQ